MGNSKLVASAEVTKASQSLAKRLDPQIQTTAKPATDWLLQARAEVSSNTTVQALFRRVKAEALPVDWLVDQLATQLVLLWDGHDEDATEAAQYLADEFFQVGEGIHIVSAETGRIVTTVTERDIYQPADVPREGGGMAKPLPRLNPQLEAFITTWTFEQKREEQLLSKLIERGYKTTALSGPDDPRLAPTTRHGRSHIVASLAEMTPESLLRGLGGTSAAFLSHFRVQTRPPDDPGLEGPLEGTAESRSVLKIADPVTTNLKHDRKATLRGVLPQGWVREIACRISIEARGRNGRTVAEADLQESDLEDSTFWVSPPELMGSVLKLRSGLTLLPAEAAHLMGFRGETIGVLQVPERFGAESHELFERWETVANLEYRLWIDWAKIICLNVTGISYQAHVV